jgi:hypothetical protein
VSPFPSALLPEFNGILRETKTETSYFRLQNQNVGVAPRAASHHRLLAKEEGSKGFSPRRLVFLRNPEIRLDEAKHLKFGVLIPRMGYSFSRSRTANKLGRDISLSARNVRDTPKALLSGAMISGSMSRGRTG